MKTLHFFNKKAFALVAGFFSLLTFVGCKEKQTTGTDLIPPVDNINTFEISDFDMQIDASYHDTLFTNDYNYMLMALGNISNDPFFGKTRAGIYLQFQQPAINHTFPEGSYDSVVLSIPYYFTAANAYTFFGDTSVATGNPVKLNAYQISEPFVYDPEKVYFSNDSIGYNTNPIGTGTYTINDFVKQSILNNGDTVVGMLRMKLNDATKNYIVQAPTNVFEKISSFVDYFKGIYIAPDPSSTGSFLGMFRLDGGSKQQYANAQLSFYYRPNGDTATKLIRFSFNTSNSPFFNRIRRDYTGSKANDFTNRQNADSVIIQGFPGIKSDITIKLDNKIPASIINKATLELTVLNVGMEQYFAPPIQLLVVGVNENGLEYKLADRLTNSGEDSKLGLSFIGGSPAPAIIDNVSYLKYKINVPREIQKLILEGKDKLTLRIYSSTTYPGFYRMVAGGNNAPVNQRLKFNVIYSLK